MGLLSPKYVVLGILCGYPATEVGLLIPSGPRFESWWAHHAYLCFSNGGALSTSLIAANGLHESAGTRFLAMELVPGEDLATRMEQGPIPTEQVLDIA